MPQFAILMREADDAWSRLSAARRGELLALYRAWVAELRDREQYVTGAPFGAGRLLRPTRGGVLEAPVAGRDQVLTGYFLVEAADEAAAVEIARGCPALLHGETVEVRALAK